MFRAPYAKRQTTFSRRTDNLKRFGKLGLGNPSTLWFASDQTDITVTSLVQRYGFAWSPVALDGGKLTLSSSTWGGSLPTVNFANGGANVRLGLRCDEMAGFTNAKFGWTFACPVYYPNAFAPTFIEWSFNGGGSDNNRYLPSFWNAFTPGCHVQINGANHILSAWVPANTLNPTALRKCIHAVTVRPNGANFDIVPKWKFSSGTYAPTPKTITSAAVGSYTRFAMGYASYLAATGALSSNLAFGGGVGWRGLGATDSQLDALIANWERLYPLV